MTSKMSEDFLDLFWKLADSADEIRADAVVEIIKRLQTIKKSGVENGEIFSELLYTCNRLIKALATNRQGARFGNFAALVEVLRTFKNVEAKHVLEWAEKNKTGEKEDLKDSLLGQVLVYAALLRSKKPLNDEQIKEILDRLVRIANKNVYLELYCSDIIEDLLANVTGNQFASRIFPVVKERLTCGWEQATPFDVWLLFLAWKKFANVVNKKFLKQYWQCNNLIAESVYPQLKPLILKSTSAHPKVHPICVEIVKAAVKNNNIESLWTNVIEGFLTHKDRLKVNLAFEIVNIILPELTTTTQIQHFLSKQLIRNFIHNLSHQELSLHGAAKQFASNLVSFVSNCEDPTIQVAVVKQLVIRPGTILFDTVTKTKIVSSAVGVFKPEAVYNYTLYMTNYVLGDQIEKETEINDATFHQKIACIQVLNMLNRVDLGQDWKWIRKLLNFFSMHAFFNVKKINDEGLKEFSLPKAVDSELRDIFKRCFYCIASKIIKINLKQDIKETLDCFYEIVSACNTLLQKHDSSITAHSFNSDEMESWNSLLKLLNKLRKAAKDKDPKTLTENIIFQLLLSQMMICLFTNPKEIISLTKDLETCCGKAVGYEKTKPNEPSWVEVAVDMILSVVSWANKIESNCLLYSVFHMMLPELSVAATNQILKVINPKSFEDDEEEVEDSEGGDDEEEDEESDDKTSTEESEEENLQENKIDDGLHKAMQDALGGGSDSDDVDLDNADDADLQKLDSALSAVISEKKKFSEKIDGPLLQFRSRCLDMLEIILTHASIPVVCATILPLTELIIEPMPIVNLGKNFNNRVRSILTRAIQLKKYHPYIDPKEEPPFVDIVRKLINLVEKGGQPFITYNCGFVCNSVIRCIKLFNHSETVQKNALLKEVVAEYKSLLSRFFKDRHTYVHHSFFEAFLGNYADLASQLVEDLLDYASQKDMRLIRKTQVLQFLYIIISNTAELKTWSRKKWNDLCKRYSDYVKDVLATSIEIAKPGFSRNLIKVYQVMCQRHKTLFNEELKKIPEELFIPIYPKLPKDAQTVARSLYLGGKSLKRKKPEEKRVSREERVESDEAEDSEEQIEMESSKKKKQKIQRQKSVSTPTPAKMSNKKKSLLNKTNDDISTSSPVATPQTRSSKKRKSLASFEQITSVKKKTSLENGNNSLELNEVEPISVEAMMADLTPTPRKRAVKDTSLSALSEQANSEIETGSVKTPSSSKNSRKLLRKQSSSLTPMKQNGPVATSNSASEDMKTPRMKKISNQAQSVNIQPSKIKKPIRPRRKSLTN